MKIEEIRNKLISWSQRITSEYIGLQVRFEFSESRGVYLVSLTTGEVHDMDRLSRAVMSFEDEMEDTYGYDAPLFCDNEELFSLSSKAETIIGIQEVQTSSGWSIQLDDSYVSDFSFNLAA